MAFQARRIHAEVEADTVRRVMMESPPRDDGSRAETPLHFNLRLLNLRRVTQPLALILYEKLLPGTQLVNRLQDLGYRVRTLDAPSLLSHAVATECPIVVLVDLAFRHGGVCEAIAELLQAPATKHVPVLAYASEHEAGLQEKARDAGARLVVNENALLHHLPQFLEQTLALD